MVRVFEPKIFANFKKGVTSSLALFPFRILNSSIFRMPTVSPIKTVNNVLPSLDCAQLGPYSRCCLVYLFFVHPHHHGTEGAEMIGCGLVAVCQALKYRSQLGFVDVSVGLHGDLREVIFGVCSSTSMIS